jgi:hypothetical protein
MIFDHYSSGTARTYFYRREPAGTRTLGSTALGESTRVVVAMREAASTWSELINVRSLAANSMARALIPFCLSLQRQA